MYKLFLLIVLNLFAMISQAESNVSINPIPGKCLLLSSATNGFTYELKFPEKLDLSPFFAISVVVANNGSSYFRMEGSINDFRRVNSEVCLQPGEVKQMEIVIPRTAEDFQKFFPGMRSYPGGTATTAAANSLKIEKLKFKVFTKDSASFSISGIETFGNYVPPQKIAATPGFYPFIDQYGQYKHLQWSGKVKTIDDLIEADAAEDEILKALPRPFDRDRFGGWTGGPKLNATGNFRVEKLDGKWWMVDPDGRLFWSSGITGVRFGDRTRTSGRENFFENLPAPTDPLGMFYETGKTNTTYDFYKANLFRKYGDKWIEKATQKSLKRLQSWGLNSFGNWSDPKIYFSAENRVPYTVPITPDWPKADGKDFEFPNVFDPQFEASIKKAIGKIDPRSLKDEYCIGFFIDNELVEIDITKKLMQLPVHDKSRLPFFDYLKGKYPSVVQLNKSWASNYESWEQVQSISTLPDGAKADISNFDLKMLDIYYKTCRTELKRVAPDKLYFGSRLPIHFYPDDQTESKNIQVAAQYCDVVCFNRYRFSAEDLILPFGIDKPTLIGEFHVGTFDRGVPGLCVVANQEQRADAYYAYIEGALNNPQIVGANWFHYADFPFSGMQKQANYQEGFVDICDIPYPELTSAARRIGYKMYGLRYDKKNP